MEQQNGDARQSPAWACGRIWCSVVWLPMKRREFIALIGGATTSVSLAARAQQPFRVGVLETGGDTSFFIVPFSRKLEELGYLEGKNLIIHRKRAEGNTERLKEFAAELVQERVDVIVTVGTPAGFAALTVSISAVN